MSESLIQVIRCENDKDTLLVQMDRRTFINLVSGWGGTSGWDRLKIMKTWDRFNDCISFVQAGLNSNQYNNLKTYAIDICKELEDEREW